MAAYLVGTRGTARHALALGLTVTVSHTVGVLALAGVILALRLVTPESYNHATGILSGLVVIAIGLWLFARQGLPVIRKGLADRRGPRDSVRAESHDHHHDHGHHHDHDAAEQGRAGASAIAGTHSHGGIRHTHAPGPDTPLGWRSLFALGLFGGLVPSINALIILLATLATGRALYGLVLVVAFGAGMALVLGGIGLGLVYATRWMERSPRSSIFSGIVAWGPALTSATILVVGLYITSQAIVGRPIL
jgi:ABC-type nickel/cobalt efflux system permease component RcnA